MKQSLTSKRAEILEDQFAGRSWEGPDCRNKRPGTGWAIVGHSGFTVAIQTAGLPVDNFWGGSNPTPSTQSPKEIVDYCYKNFN